MAMAPLARISLLAQSATTYDGLVSSSLARATFTRMQDGTAEEYAVIHAREEAYNRSLHVRVLGAVRALDAAEPDPGYAVSRLAHSLQSATRAERDGRPVDYVVAALIHDIGDGLAPYSHGSYAAAVLRPFVAEELCWIVSHHPLFQMYYYGAQTGDDANAREAYHGHPWFDATVEFCERYDENCFDPSYDWLPLEHFAPAVQEVFSREPAFR
jgi:predicted HD phosphohydrolase